jgi:pentatricopeptide repeat protein
LLQYSSSSSSSTAVPSKNSQKNVERMIMEESRKDPRVGFEYLQSILLKNTNDSFVPKEKLLIAMFSHCYKSKQIREMFQLFELINRYYPETKMSASSVLSAVYGLIDAGQFENGLKLFQLLTNSNIKLNERSLSILLMKLNNTKMFSSAIHLFKEILENRPDLVAVHSFTIIINMYIQNQQFADALLLFQKMRECSIQPTAITYSVLIKGFIDYDRKNKPLILYKSIVDENSVQKWIEKEDTSCKHVLECIKLLKSTEFKRIEVAFKIFKMQHEDYEKTRLDCVKPDLRSYNILLDGLVSNGLLSDAKALIASMQARNISINSTTINTILTGYLSNGQIKEAEEFLSRQTIELGTDTFNLFINYQIKVMKNDSSDRINCASTIIKYYKAMLSNQRSQPDSITCSLLIEMYCLIGRKDYAFSIFNEMMKPVSTNLSSGEDIPLVHLPNIITRTVETYGVIIYYMPENANALFQKMVNEEKLMPNLKIMNTMSNILPAEEAFDMWERIRERYPGICPDMLTMALLFIKGSHSLNDIGKRLRIKKPKPSKLITFLFRNNNVALFQSFCDVFQKQHSPTKGEYMLLLKLYCQMDNVEEATKLWEIVLSKEIVPDQKFVEEIIRVWTMPIISKKKYNWKEQKKYFQRAHKLSKSLGKPGQFERVKRSEKIIRCLKDAVKML